METVGCWGKLWAGRQRLAKVLKSEGVGGQIDGKKGKDSPTTRGFALRGRGENRFGKGKICEGGKGDVKQAGKGTGFGTNTKKTRDNRIKRGKKNWGLRKKFQKVTVM